MSVHIPIHMSIHMSYTHVYTHVYSPVHTQLYTHLHTHTLTTVYKHVDTYVDAHACAHVVMCTETCHSHWLVRLYPAPSASLHNDVAMPSQCPHICIHMLVPHVNTNAGDVSMTSKTPTYRPGKVVLSSVRRCRARACMCECGCVAVW